MLAHISYHNIQGNVYTLSSQCMCTFRDSYILLLQSRLNNMTINAQRCLTVLCKKKKKKAILWKRREQEICKVHNICRVCQPVWLVTRCESRRLKRGQIWYKNCCIEYNKEYVLKQQMLVNLLSGMCSPIWYECVVEKSDMYDWN